MLPITVLLLQKGVIYSKVWENIYACDNFSQLLPNFINLLQYKYSGTPFNIPWFKYRWS